MSGGSISVIIPVLNERENIGPLVSSFDVLKRGYGFEQLKELIFVDDGSSDGTVPTINQEIGMHPYEIKMLKRSKKMGTVDATIAGSKLTESDAIVVMDGDMQHPPHIILEMVKELNQGHDLVIASRHTRGGQNLWRPLRGVISRGAILMAYFLIPQSRKIRDPTSGFFLADRKLVTELSPISGRAKLLLYLLSTSNASNPLEIPYTFIERRRGRSKVIGRNLKFIPDYMIEVLGYMKNAHKNKNISLEMTIKESPNARK